MGSSGLNVDGHTGRDKAIRSSGLSSLSSIFGNGNKWASGPSSSLMRRQASKPGAGAGVFEPFPPEDFLLPVSGSTSHQRICLPCLVGLLTSSTQRRSSCTHSCFDQACHNRNTPLASSSCHFCPCPFLSCHLCPSRAATNPSGP